MKMNWETRQRSEAYENKNINLIKLILENVNKRASNLCESKPRLPAFPTQCRHHGLEKVFFSHVPTCGLKEQGNIYSVEACFQETEMRESEPHMFRFSFYNQEFYVPRRAVSDGVRENCHCSGSQEMNGNFGGGKQAYYYYYFNLVA